MFGDDRFSLFFLDFPLLEGGNFFAITFFMVFDAENASVSWPENRVWPKKVSPFPPPRLVCAVFFRFGLGVFTGLAQVGLKRKVFLVLQGNQWKPQKT